MLTIELLQTQIKEIYDVEKFIDFLEKNEEQIYLLFHSMTIRELELIKLKLEELFYILEDNRLISKVNHSSIEKFLVLLFDSLELLRFRGLLNELRVYLIKNSLLSNRLKANLNFLNINNISEDYHKKFETIISLLDNEEDKKLYVDSIRTLLIYFMTAIQSFHKIQNYSLERSFKELFFTYQNRYKILQDKILQNVIEEVTIDNVEHKVETIFQTLYEKKIDKLKEDNYNFNITNYLSRINSDFFLEKNSWCNLVYSQFSNSIYIDYNQKNYSEIYLEQYYLLRFASLYFYEYVEAYKIFFKNYHKKSIRILSVGVGSGLDYYGLLFAIKELNLHIKINYLGIDLEDWHYRDIRINFIQINLKDIADNIEVMNFIKEGIDLVIFPKSLIEIDKIILSDFAELLIKNSLNNIWFLNSYIKKGDKISGIEEFITLAKRLEYNGYKLNFGESTDKYFLFDEKKISFFNYRNTWFKAIKNHCHSRCENEKIDKCQLANQHQMMNTKNLAIGLFNFKKI